jgi:CheY-like chemotaxis protein
LATCAGIQVMAKKARILLACVKQGYTRIFAIITGHPLTFVSTLSDAQAALESDRFDLIMIGVHFDESRMFDLLKYVKADARHSQAPIVCFRGVSVEDNDDRAMGGVETACLAMGADAFFDLEAFTDDALGNAAVLKIIHGLLARGCGC